MKRNDLKKALVADPECRLSEAEIESGLQAAESSPDGKWSSQGGKLSIVISRGDYNAGVRH